ncbi:MAG TPA: hypothetical protein QGF50_15275 [Roseibacillus sp.]|jgi:hypothetical protein|nr:hypothetical protein [Roseibacillus sp.]|tara:strand:+ start:190 stop:381 length:192 start_codon:yes stop_codon:yes gene_type:complete
MASKNAFFLGSTPHRAYFKLVVKKKTPIGKRWRVVLGLMLLGGSSANGEILSGVMAIKGAEMK